MNIDNISKLTNEGKETYKRLLDIEDGGEQSSSFTTQIETAEGLTLGKGTDDEVSVTAGELNMLFGAKYTIITENVNNEGLIISNADDVKKWLKNNIIPDWLLMPDGQIVKLCLRYEEDGTLWLEYCYHNIENITGTLNIMLVTISVYYNQDTDELTLRSDGARAAAESIPLG